MKKVLLVSFCSCEEFFIVDYDKIIKSSHNNYREMFITVKHLNNSTYSQSTSVANVSRVNELTIQLYWDAKNSKNKHMVEGSLFMTWANQNDVLRTSPSSMSWVQGDEEEPFLGINWTLFELPVFKQKKIEEEITENNPD